MTAPTPKLVPCKSTTTTVTIKIPCIHQCPFENETDEGTLRFTWVCDGRTIELHSLRAWLDSLDEWAVSHEDYTDHISRTLRGLGLTVYPVSSTWTTAGATVEVVA